MLFGIHGLKAACSLDEFVSWRFGNVEIFTIGAVRDISDPQENTLTWSKPTELHTPNMSGWIHATIQQY